MSVRKWLPPIPLVSFVIVSCSSLSDSDNYSTFVDVPGAACFSVSVAGTRVFRDDSSWTALWEQGWNCWYGGRKTPPPSVDFANEMVIAVFWGTRPNGCTNYATAIEYVRSGRWGLEVHVGPLPDLGPCDMVVEPLQMIKVKNCYRRVFFTGLVPG